MATDTAAPPAEASAPSQPKSKLVLIVGLVAIIITAQVIITWLLMPKPQDTAAAAGENETLEESPANEPVEAVETPLGDFQCTNTINPGTTVQVDFKLIAVTHPDKVSRLTGKTEAFTGRLRQTVGKVIRSAKLEDLSEASHSTLRRLLKEEINRLLRTEIDDVILIDFRQIDQ